MVRPRYRLWGTGRKESFSQADVIKKMIDSDEFKQRLFLVENGAVIG